MKVLSSRTVLNGSEREQENSSGAEEGDSKSHQLEWWRDKEPSLQNDGVVW